MKYTPESELIRVLTVFYVTTAAPPGIQAGPNRVEIQGHFKYLGSIMQGNGGQDREIQSRINTASQVLRSLKKSVFTSNLGT